MSKTVGETGEREIIRILRNRFPQIGDHIGDDGAVLPSVELPVVTTDSFIEEVHFFRWWTSAQILGRRLMEASLSDLAAMGCSSPGWALVSLNLPGFIGMKWLLEFYKGLLWRNDLEIVGGEIVKSATLGITISALGEGKGENDLLRRSTLIPGNNLWVTGKIGRALNAPDLLEKCGGFTGEIDNLQPLKTGLNSEQIEQVKDFLLPTAQFNEAAVIRDAGVKAAIDISDGLISEACHLALESNVDIQIESEKIPFYLSVAREPEAAASAGEDYVLLFGAELKMDFSDIRCRKVGFARQGTGRVFWSKNGKTHEITSGGYDHFS